MEPRLLSICTIAIIITDFVYIVFLIILGNTVVVNSLNQNSVHTASKEPANKPAAELEISRRLLRYNEKTTS